jgi:hypothetical protein
MTTRTVPLDSKNLASGIEALSSAAQAFRLTRFETAAYDTLMLSVAVTGWSLIGLIFPPGLAVLGVADVVWRGVGVALLTAVLYGASLGTVALALNIPLACRLYRERARPSYPLGTDNRASHSQYPCGGVG